MKSVGHYYMCEEWWLFTDVSKVHLKGVLHTEMNFHQSLFFILLKGKNHTRTWNFFSVECNITHAVRIFVDIRKSQLSFFACSLVLPSFVVCYVNVTAAQKIITVTDALFTYHASCLKWPPSAWIHFLTCVTRELENLWTTAELLMLLAMLRICWAVLFSHSPCVHTPLLLCNPTHGNLMVQIWRLWRPILCSASTNP